MSSKPIKRGPRPAKRGDQRLGAPIDGVLRGTILDPVDAGDCRMIRDGGLAVVGGAIAMAGPFDAVARAYPNLAADEPQEGRGRLILPAFCDTHVHWVQYRRRGIAKPLLEWLREDIWPEEAKFADPAYARAAAAEFFGDLAARGTLAASIYSSVHESAVAAAFAAAFGYAIVGNVLMTVNAPPDLLLSENETLAITAALANQNHGSYAVTPRFAPNCSMRVMQGAARIAGHSGSWIQSHLSENESEVEWVGALFPGIEHYAGTYERAGLLGPRTIMAHCIHLTAAEYDLLAATGTRVSHCPISNRELGSGRMPLAPLRERGIPWALGTDVGASPWLSMLAVMRAFLEIHRGHERVSATESLYRATGAGWEMLGLGDTGGRLAAGFEANVAIIDRPAPIAASDDAETVLLDLLSASEAELETAVSKVYLAGVAVDSHR